jgi:hypothetical protein
VCAKSEFDLGKFNTIQHGIDTGTNRPVKQRIRRTPLGFAGEEEAQLKKISSPFDLSKRLVKCSGISLFPFSGPPFSATSTFCIPIVSTFKHTSSA